MPLAGRTGSGAIRARGCRQAGACKHAPARGCGQALRSAHFTQVSCASRPGAAPLGCPGLPLLSQPSGARTQAPALRVFSPSVPVKPSPSEQDPGPTSPEPGAGRDSHLPARGCPSSRFFPGRQETDPARTATGGAPHIAALASAHRPWPPPPQNHSAGRPSAHLHAPPPGTPPSSLVCGSGLRPQTREEAKPASPVPPQRAADSSRASRRRPRRGRALVEGQRDRSPRRVLAALRWGSPLRCAAGLEGAAAARPVPGTLPRTSPRAASRVAGGAARGAGTRRRSLWPPWGRSHLRGRGERLSDHNLTNEESTLRKKVERRTGKE